MSASCGADHRSMHTRMHHWKERRNMKSWQREGRSIFHQNKFPCLEVLHLILSPSLSSDSIWDYMMRWGGMMRKSESIPLENFFFSFLKKIIYRHSGGLWVIALIEAITRTQQRPALRARFLSLSLTVSQEDRWCRLTKASKRCHQWAPAHMLPFSHTHSQTQSIE